MTLEDIKNAIQKAETIAILVHESPDGDAIGSATAMNLALKQLGKNPDVIIPEFSRTFNFLPGVDEIKKETNVESYDLTITLDCGDQKRVSNCAKYFEDAQKVCDECCSRDMEDYSLEISKLIVDSCSLIK